MRTTGPSNNKYYSSYRTLKYILDNKILCNFKRHKIHQDSDYLKVQSVLFMFRLFQGESLAELCPLKTSLSKKVCVLSLDSIRCILRNIHRLLLKFHIHNTKEVTLKARAVEITAVVNVAVICINLWIFIFPCWGGVAVASVRRNVLPSPHTYIV
jgi:hypothetical protein